MTKRGNEVMHQTPAQNPHSGYDTIRPQINMQWAPLTLPLNRNDTTTKAFVLAHFWNQDFLFYSTLLSPCSRHLQKTNMSNAYHGWLSYKLQLIKLNNKDHYTLSEKKMI